MTRHPDKGLMGAASESNGAVIKQRLSRSQKEREDSHDWYGSVRRVSLARHAATSGFIRGGHASADCVTTPRQLDEAIGLGAERKQACIRLPTTAAVPSSSRAPGVVFG